MTTAETSKPPTCIYPGSHPTRRPIQDELDGVAANQHQCSSFYLDTVEGMSNDIFSTEGEYHHQGLARTHRLARNPGPPGWATQGHGGNWA